MVPVIPVDRVDLDKVGKLLDESLVVLRLDEVVVPPGQVESLGRGGGGQVDLRWTVGSVPLQVSSGAPVEGLEFSLKISKIFSLLEIFSSLLDVLSSVNNGPGRGSSREMLHLLRQVCLVLLLNIKPGSR